MDINSTIVASGSMQVKDGGILRAYLGSCVGLALYDPDNRCGGLAHLLLPRPVSMIPESHLTSYATTGVPCLIEALIQRGATPERMVAYIAGGALVDPLSPTDLNLNIGGRTLEITIDILTKHGIAIRRLEASGFTPSQIIFNTASGECRIEPILALPGRVRRVSDKPSKREDIIKSMNRIMPVPQLALKVFNLLSEESVELSVVAAEVKKDQVMTARLLRLSNSAYVSPAKPITSIDQALLYLGSQSVLKLVMTALTEEIFARCGEGGYSLCRGGMFYHALGTARLSERLAAISGKVKPDMAYTAGLMHDIGKVVLDQSVALDQPQFYRLLNESGKDSALAERELFATDHTETGRLLLESWHLPEIYCAVAAGHHAPAEVESHVEAVHLAHVADIFIHKFSGGLEIENLSTAGLDASLTLLQLTPEAIYTELGAVSRID